MNTTSAPEAAARPRKARTPAAPLPPIPPVGSKALKGEPLLSTYNLVREFIGSVAASGWRNVFCWGAILLVLSAYWRAQNGIEVDLEAFRSLADLVLAAFVWRGAIDKGGLSDLVRAGGEAIGRARKGPPPGGAVAAG